MLNINGKKNNDIKRKSFIKRFLRVIFTKKLVIDCIQTMIKTLVITLVTTLLLFVINNIFKKHQEIEYTNNTIDKLYLGENKEYVGSILGIPQFEFIDEGLSNSFYPMEQVVIRCVFDDELLVGYFVTAKNADSRIKIRNPYIYSEVIRFGNNTFDPEEYPDAVIDGYVAMGANATINTYYWEYSYLYGTGLHKSYVAAILPYGFTEKDSYNLMTAAHSESIESQEIADYRKNLHPNTIGMMDSHYKDIIKPYMPNDENYILWMESMMKLIGDIQLDN